MRSKRYPLEFESHKANNMRVSREGWGYKYVCHNDTCPNYKQEFDYWELED